MDCYCGHSLQSHNKDGCQHADSATKSGMDLVCRCAMTPDQIADARITALEAELADARTANEMAAKHFKEFEQDGATIRDLREQLNAANTAASANLRMASEQAQKVGALKMAITKIAGICNDELFGCEDVKREDLIDTVQAYFDIQQITDGILEATK